MTNCDKKMKILQDLVFVSSLRLIFFFHLMSTNFSFMFVLDRKCGEALLRLCVKSLKAHFETFGSTQLKRWLMFRNTPQLIQLIPFVSNLFAV